MILIFCIMLSFLSAQDREASTTRYVSLFPLDLSDAEKNILDEQLSEGGDYHVYALLKKKLAERGDSLKIDNFERLGLKRTFLEKLLAPWKYISHIEEKGVRRYLVWNQMITGHHCKQAFARLPKEKMVLFLWEPPSTFPRLYNKRFHRFFSKIYTWDDDLVDNKTYFKFYYPVLSKEMETSIPFEEKKLCMLIVSNKHSKHPHELYSERRKVIDFFEKQAGGDFDFYGYGWDTQYKNYKGAVVSKYEVMKKYRFCICYENISHVKGYISEKIFDCFRAGVVPVYLGASNVAEYIPKECFIAREDFASDEELYAFLRSMAKETYEGYLQNIKAYLHSEKAQLFSMEHFVKTCLEGIYDL